MCLSACRELLSDHGESRQSFFSYQDNKLRIMWISVSQLHIVLPTVAFSRGAGMGFQLRERSRDIEALWFQGGGDFKICL